MSNLEFAQHLNVNHNTAWLMMHKLMDLTAGDGRLLDGSDLNLWHEYIQGQSPRALSDRIIRKLLKDNETNDENADASTKADW